MQFKSFISRLGFGALLVASPLGASAAGGTVYFDWAALTTELQNNTSGFSGWQYVSRGTATVGAVRDSEELLSEDLSASVGATRAVTRAGSLQVETSTGGHSQGYQQFSTTIQLTGGQHFVYQVPYTVVMHKELLAERVEMGIGFNITSEDGDYNIDKSFSTLNWREPLGTGSESGYLELDLYNPYDTPISYSFNGWLGAASQTSVSAVPEPSAYMLFMLGLGMVGIARRRRRI